jgi:hypothetical protein
MTMLISAVSSLHRMPLDRSGGIRLSAVAVRTSLSNLTIPKLSRRYVSARELLLTVLAAAALCLPACSAWSQTTATVTVNATSVSAAVPPEGYGLNTYVYDGDITSSGVASEVQASGVTPSAIPAAPIPTSSTSSAAPTQTMNDGAIGPE